MSITRKLIIAFWIFIIVMLLWQFHSYDQKLDVAPDRPQHFYFYPPTNAVATAAPAPVHREGPEVKQTSFSFRNNVPSQGSFTCKVTLKNVGTAKAVDVRVNVRPFRGTFKTDEDVGRSTSAVLSDTDPISQMGQWVTFPNLNPGETSTRSAIFISRTDVKPGTNPNPEIEFQTEKAKP